jgi:hypothetical protein
MDWPEESCCHHEWEAVALIATRPPLAIFLVTDYRDSGEPEKTLDVFHGITKTFTRRTHPFGYFGGILVGS